MKLKAMYTCVTRHADSDGAYETNDKKTYQTKKLHKASKRSVHRPKWQQLSKTPKTPPKTPPRKPYMIETPPPPTIPPPPVPVEEPPPAPKRNSLCTKSPVSNKPSTPPPEEVVMRGQPSDNSVNPFCSSSVVKRSSLRENDDRTSAFGQNAYPLERRENTNLTKSSIGSEELSSSQDDVFSRSSPTWLVTGENIRNKRFADNEDDSDDETLNLLQAMKINSLEEEDVGEDCRQPLLQSTHDDIEDLKNEMMKTYFNNAVRITAENAMGPRTGSMSSLSSSASSSSVTTSVDRATASFETVRAICDEQRATKAHSFEQRRRLITAGRMQKKNCSVTTTPSSRRAFSTSVANKNVNWSDIPPLIPPREPVRHSRSAPRNLSTPSPPSPPRTTTPPATRLSSSAHFESSRSKDQAQSCTTPVFSALPPNMTGSNPVILPIMKDGKQESFTHYYLLEDEESAPKTQRPPRPAPEPLIGIARPSPSTMTSSFNRSGSAPPRPPPPTGSFFSVTLDSNNTSKTNRSSTSPDHSIVSSRSASTYPPFKRPSPSIKSPLDSSVNDASSPVPRYCDMAPGQKVVALQSEVFGVTDEECQSALRLNKWDVIKSIKYLMVEQLFRVGISTWENCHQILQTTKWDLQSASRVLLEQHQNNRTANS